MHNVVLIKFRTLTATDLPMLHGWMQRPHVAQWWGEPRSLAELERDYLPRTRADSSTRAYMALRDGEPFGFIQSYVVMGSGDGWWEEETDPGARGIDQFLANADDLGRGLGSAMVAAFVRLLFLDPMVTSVQTDPAPGNLRAIRSYRKAGFTDAGDVLTPDGPAQLMICRRGETVV